MWTKFVKKLIRIKRVGIWGHCDGDGYGGHCAD